MLRRSRTRVWAGIAAIFTLLLGVIAGIVVWPSIEGIRNPSVDELPARADAVVVFAGEDERFNIGRELVEDGIAPVLVLSAGQLPANARGWCDESIKGVPVVCLTPLHSSTRGEGQAFGALATEEGWTSIVGVTADYHVQRAKLHLNRCFTGEIAMVQLAWGTPSIAILKSELLAFGHAHLIERSCH